MNTEWIKRNKAIKQNLLNQVWNDCSIETEFFNTFNKQKCMMCHQEKNEFYLIRLVQDFDSSVLATVYVCFYCFMKNDNDEATEKDPTKYYFKITEKAQQKLGEKIFTWFDIKDYDFFQEPDNQTYCDICGALLKKVEINNEFSKTNNWLMKYGYYEWTLELNNDVFLFNICPNCQENEMIKRCVGIKNE